MKFLDILKRPFARSTAPDIPRLTSSSNSVRRTAAGIYVSPDRALHNDTAWACHRYLTQTAAQLPAILRRRLPNGKDELAPMGPVIHPVDYVLNWRPNPEISPFQFKETLMSWAILYGNGYAEIERDLVGRVINIWPIEPWRAQLVRDDNGELFLRVQNKGRDPTDLAYSDVFHLRGFGNNVCGLSVIEYAAQTIGWAQATELFGATFFGEGMHFSGAVTLQGKASPESIHRMREELENQHKGVARSNRWVFFDNQAKIEKMVALPDEAQFIQSLQHQVESLCRWFGVPPQKVMHLLRMTFNNVEQLAIEVVVDSIAPWAERFEQEATFKLFGQNRQNLFVMMDLKGLLRGDFLTRQQGWQILRRNGVVTANDWAANEHLPAISGAGGDKYIVEGNMTTLDSVGELPINATQPQLPTSEPQAPTNQAEQYAKAMLKILERERAGVYVQ